MIITINPENPQPRLISKASDIIKKGGIIAYPTDTFYGLGCDIFNKSTINRLYHLKQRETKHPFSFICSDLKNIATYCNVSNYAYKTMKRLLPGPYTFVLDGTKAVPKILKSKRKTVGIRIPDHPICLAIVTELSQPVISTSATTPDGKILTNVWEIEEELGHAIDLIIDGGPISSEPSTVVAITDNEAKIIREGKGDIRCLL